MALDSKVAEVRKVVIPRAILCTHAIVILDIASEFMKQKGIFDCAFQKVKNSNDTPPSVGIGKDSVSFYKTICCTRKYTCVCLRRHVADFRSKTSFSLVD